MDTSGKHFQRLEISGPTKEMHKLTQTGSLTSSSVIELGPITFPSEHVDDCRWGPESVWLSSDGMWKVDHNFWDEGIVMGDTITTLYTLSDANDRYITDFSITHEMPAGQAPQRDRHWGIEAEIKDNWSKLHYITRSCYCN